MPELPEVETIKNALLLHVAGRRIAVKVIDIFGNEVVSVKRLEGSDG